MKREKTSLRAMSAGTILCIGLIVACKSSDTTVNPTTTNAHTTGSVSITNVVKSKFK